MTSSNAPVSSATFKRQRWRLYAVVLICSLLFALALGAKESFSVWISTGLAASLSLILCFGVHGPALRRLLRPRPGTVVSGVVGGAVMAAATHLLYPLTSSLVPGLDDAVKSLYADLLAPPGLIAALPVLALVVVAEECVWRGVLLDAMRLRRRTLAAVLASSFFYTLPQLGSASPVLFALALVCGAVWGAQRVLSRSLVAPTLTHLVWDVLVFVVFPLETLV